ncbi:MerR family transcriptional regulator [Glutamicibacter sp. AOP5-A2-18]|uniref:MerR family transcriptional regulator n=1 Tax=Glutamicibacter sp. AOP5-A2-18 TaxID=3457656 RepID=UPI0040348C65
MRIGELSERSGVPTRMLRYYEEQGLLTPGRSENGYRYYEAPHLERVEKIRGLIEAGIPTRIISDILPCLDRQREIVVVDPDPGLREVLLRERDRMAKQINLLTQNRDSITRYVEAMDGVKVLAS